MEIKPGVKTSEFYITAVVNVISAAVALMAAYGLVSDSEADLWVQLGRTVVSLVAPAIMAYVTSRYSSGRTALKTAALWGQSKDSQ